MVQYCSNCATFNSDDEDYCTTCRKKLPFVVMEDPDEEDVEEEDGI